MWQALSTSNDIILNLFLIPQPKLRIKEPASQSFYNATAVGCRQCKKPYNDKKIESYQLEVAASCHKKIKQYRAVLHTCLLYTSPSPRD